jgi:hypothetical protein
MNGPFQECKRQQSVLHPCRKVDFGKAQRLAKHDGLFIWSKGWYRSQVLSPAQWGLLPAQITVRIIRFTATIRGFCNRRITLVTSLRDPQRYRAQELIALYARRWRLALCLYDWALAGPSFWKGRAGVNEIVIFPACLCLGLSRADSCHVPGVATPDAPGCPFAAASRSRPAASSSANAVP